MDEFELADQKMEQCTYNWQETVQELIVLTEFRRPEIVQAGCKGSLFRHCRRGKASRVPNFIQI